MPKTSAFTGFGHLRFSGAPSEHQQFYGILQKLWGSEIDFSQVGSYVEAKLYAWSRLLAQAKGEIEHAANQANPNKAYDCLPNLELDVQYAPAASDDYIARQKAVAAAWAFNNGEMAGNVVQQMRNALGATFLAYVPNPAGNPVPTPLNPGSSTTGHWTDVRIPPKFLKLVDPMASKSISPPWVAYQAMDTSALPTITWSPSASFAVGQEVLPTTVGANGFYFQCTTAGTTGTSEPVWPSQTGGTVVDGSVTWTCVAPVAPPLKVGDTVIVDAGNTSQQETITIAAVASSAANAPGALPGNYLYFKAQNYLNTHDIGAPVCSGSFPYWWCTQRLAYIVVNFAVQAAQALDGNTQQKINAILPKIFRAVCQWAIVVPTSTTATGGTIGPMTVGAGMGVTSIGAINYSNSH